MTSIPASIFKAYDVRAIYPVELNEDAAFKIGRAYVAYLDSSAVPARPARATRIAVSRDMRVSSPSLCAAFIDGATTQGADVVDYGMTSTDMLYFIVVDGQFEGGAMITASHNPKQYNGVKMVRQGAFPLSGDAGIGEISQMVTQDAIPAATRPKGKVTQADALQGYLRKVMSFIDIPSIKPFNVVLDAGCGMAGLVAPPLFDRLPCKTTKLCFTIDGTFPTHEANPLLEENRADIVARVVAEKADIGIAWDGDADRCFFIDGHGEFIAGDFITALLAQAFLLKFPNEKIIYDVRASFAVKDIVAAHGGTALMNKVGHAFIKARMREENAIFGGEVTGHYYFRDYFFCDNGFIPALLILELMSKQGKTLHELLEPLRAKYFISGEINTSVSGHEVVQSRLDALKKKYSDGNTYEVDGFSVEYPDWHFNVRASNTEPLLRLNLEAKTEALMEKKRHEVLEVIRST